MTDTTANPPQYRRGLKPFDPAKHAALPSLADLGTAYTWPTPVYPLDKSGGVTSFGMGGNGPDPTLSIQGGPFGDCGPNAVPKNANQATAGVLGLGYTALTSDQIVTLYFIFQAQQAGISWRPPTGGGWTPPPGLDVGVDLGEWLTWLATHDIEGLPVPVGSGLIGGFVKLDLAEMDAALEAGFAVVVGVILTNEADQQFPGTWTLAPGEQPNPDDGHAIERLGAQAADGPKAYATWGGVQLATDPWDKACVQQAFGVYTIEQAIDPAFPRAAMVSAIEALGGTVATTPPGPTPAPPGPSTPPPAPTPPPTVSDGLMADIEHIAHEAITAIVSLAERLGGSVPEWTGERR